MLLTRGNTAVRCRHLADSRNICTPIRRASVLVLSTVFTTRCQGFAVSSSGIVSHEYAKLWDCQAARSWSGAELVQHSLTQCYCGDLSSSWKYMICFSYQGKSSAIYCILAVILFFLLLLYTQYIMTNSFAIRGPQGLDCAQEIVF